jgi:phosphopantothenoylcysteine decarboxylase/phosphopantothenate--cysteine ligase
MLVSGQTALATPAGVERFDVLTASEMHDAVMSRAAQSDIFIAVAAVGDYRAAETKGHKIKRGNGKLSIDLEPNPDILADVAAMKKPPFCVGFAAESENVEENAKAKRAKKNVPLLAANRVQDAFGKDTNALTLFDDKGKHELASAPKIVLARQLIEHIAKMLPRR